MQLPFKRDREIQSLKQCLDRQPCGINAPRPESGQVLILAVIFMAILVMLGTVVLSLIGQNVIVTRNALADEQALHLAEGGIDKAVWQLNETGGSYSGELGTVLGTGVFDVVITNLSGSRKEITATGYVPDKTNPRRTKTVRVEAGIDTTITSFNYGVQVGDGGLEMSNNSKITGNVYSNGTIDGENGARITGDAFSAGPLGRIFDRLQIDGSAYARTINQNITIGGSAYGQVMNQITIGGDVYTNSISNCTVGGNANYTSISGCSVGGSQNPGYPGEDDPEALDFPVSDQQIDDWKAQASAGGTIVGNYTLDNGAQGTLGPKKITGDFTLSNNAVLTLTGPVWVQGDIDVSNGAIIRLDPSYGEYSEVLITDDVVDISNNAIFEGAGQDSYLLMISTISGEAFDVANNADALIIFAPNGEVEISNNAILREITAWRIELSNGAEVIYESGLANAKFLGGPGASWQIVRGTWREAN